MRWSAKPNRMVRFHYSTLTNINKMEHFKSILLFVLTLGLTIGMCVACRMLQPRDEVEYYNVIYTQAGKTTEYYDVTNLSKWEGKITFTTCDGATVILDDGCIEIIPIDVD